MDQDCPHDVFYFCISILRNEVMTEWTLGMLLVSAFLGALYVAVHWIVEKALKIVPDPWRFILCNIITAVIVLALVYFGKKNLWQFYVFIIILIYTVGNIIDYLLWTKGRQIEASKAG